MRQNSQFRKILTQEWARRQKLNRRFSLRAFANSLAVSPSRLSEFLNGKGGISAVRAFEIIDRLNLSQDESESLRLIIQKEMASTTLLKRHASKQLNEQKKKFRYARSFTSQSTIDRLTWEHLYIAEIVSDEGLHQDQIGKRLSINSNNLLVFLEEARDLNLVEPLPGQPQLWRAQHKSRWFGEDKASSSIRRLHFQILRQIPGFCESCENSDRELNSSLLQLSEDQVQVLRKMIRKFAKDSLAAATKATNPNKRLYGLAIQLFPIEKTKGEL